LVGLGDKEEIRKGLEGGFGEKRKEGGGRAVEWLRKVGVVVGVEKGVH